MEPDACAGAEYGIRAIHHRAHRRPESRERRRQQCFYSPSIGDDGDNTYAYAQFKPSFPDISWPPLTEVAVSDRGLLADPAKKSLLSAASKVRHLTPAIGTELLGIDLRQLTDAQKDELALLVAERGVVFFRDQEIDVYGQLDIARHFGPLHKHATTPIPRNGLEEVHVVYNDSSRRPDPASFSKLELWHTDVSYEIQPPSTTSLKVITGPEYGGDTLWSSGYALYSSFSPGFQKYLEGLTALHSAVAQADGSRAAGLPVRREPIETIHPVVRVHPVTGWKSIYVNPGFTRRIIGLPKAESDAILQLLFHQIAQNPDFQVRFKWEHNDIAFWDNRVVTHSATFDFFPETRHALRATPHGEKPLSVAAYEKQTGKVAKDRQIEIWRQKGIELPGGGDEKPKVARYND
ncbi:Alpha-ketoglutarate-dependent taurine dioxygenase [Mycena indigotica]|uniref:Alpha-ketoglutarate-dependent taurine dioxygenase n=1 Tax=Mycena indigotica TaxID=2126181 RepID=A0A8H6T5L4_9AGAR|nr:Alpha-ketoglutarate-dependent taurine dioxygenase [Mycena indigotica]KAF7312515.1 Alpha-ketoglutarate-dependent taurine dioxygenase [Mycena indigotica]